MATRKIHFFTGKGGVGKTAVSAGFSISAARESKKKILLTELSADGDFNDLFKQNLVLKNINNLEIAQWTAQLCLQEYASSLLRSEALSKLFVNNKFSKSLINIAPGLQELAILGKATSGPRNHGPQMGYDEIFIDSYASGHFMSLINAPKTFSEIFSVGPMATQSKSIDLFMRNPDFTKIHIVTTADELSVSESVEHFKNIVDFKLAPNFILNKTIDTTQLDLKKMPEKTKNFFANLVFQQTEAVAQLKKLKAQIIFIPHVFNPAVFNVALEISDHLNNQGSLK